MYYGLKLVLSKGKRDRRSLLPCEKNDPLDISDQGKSGNALLHLA